MKNSDKKKTAEAGLRWEKEDIDHEDELSIKRASHSRTPRRGIKINERREKEKEKYVSAGYFSF